MPHNPPPPPPHPHSPHDNKPISPPLDSLPHNKAAKEGKGRTLIIAIALGSLITAIVGFILNYFSISVNIILPVLAPIWVGTITLIYSVNIKN